MTAGAPASLVAPHRPRTTRLIAFLSAIVVVVAVLTGVLVRAGSSSTTTCSRLSVPAFFYPGPEWSTMLGGPYLPAIVILDVTDTGAGTSKIAAFASVVDEAKKKGVTVLGYSSTSYTKRSIAKVERDVRDYRAWYGVDGILLDEVTTGVSSLGYYRTIVDYVHQHSPHAPVWFNVGAVPNPRYLKLATSVITFEGPYPQFLAQHVPRWLYSYKSTKIANVVYATTAAEWQSVQALAHSRNAGFSYITDDVLPNPYASLPSYWAAESAADAGCAS